MTTFRMGPAPKPAKVAGGGFPVRAIRRVGRRGLSSAVIEGAMSARADLIAVIDADLQHDERLLPRMHALLATTDTDIVIGSRNVECGGLGDWDAVGDTKQLSRPQEEKYLQRRLEAQVM